jgi:hypothetical protein
MPPQQPYQPYPPQQPGWQQSPVGQNNGGYRQYAGGGYQQPTGQQYAPPQPPPAPKRRRVWPWVLLAVVLIPVLIVAGCSALFVGGVSAVQDQRAGGALPIGQTFTYKDGTALTVADLGSYRSPNPYSVAKGELAFQGTVTVMNGSKNPENTVTVTINISVAGVAAERVYDAMPSTQDLAPGQTAKIPFQFKVKKGTAGPLQVSVSAGFNEPVFFTGSLK